MCPFLVCGLFDDNHHIETVGKVFVQHNRLIDVGLYILLNTTLLKILSGMLA